MYKIKSELNEFDAEMDCVAEKILNILKTETSTINEANRVMRLVYRKLGDTKVN